MLKYLYTINTRVGKCLRDYPMSENEDRARFAGQITRYSFCVFDFPTGLIKINTRKCMAIIDEQTVSYGAVTCEIVPIELHDRPSS